MPKISIIIPVYNSEEYISQCLDSVIGQTFNDLEIIIVDDGSTDSSYGICEMYCNMDSRIRLIKQHNQGNVAARRNALSHATGQYIAFVDSDDWLDKDFYEVLMTIPHADVADVIASGCIIENLQKKVALNQVEPGEYQKSDIEQQIYPCLFAKTKGRNQFSFGILQYLWNKIYRRELITECFLRLDERIYDGEDVACIFDVLLHADTIIIDDHAMYHYRVHENSICTSKRDEKFFSNTVYLYEYLYQMFCEQPVYKDLLLSQLRYLMVMFMNHGTQSAFNFMYVPKYIWTLPELPGEDMYSICLFGAGRIGMSYYEQFSQMNNIHIKLWVDNARAGENISGMDITEPELLKEVDCDYVIIAIKNGIEEIKKQICGFGINEERIISTHSQKVQCGYELQIME